jgi:regulator of sirC expression with transglutaminase-like and TPR domain
MPPILPMCSAANAYALLARQIPVINSSDALLHGAIAISMHQMDGVDPAAIDAKLQEYVDTIRSRVHGSQTQAVMAHMHEFLFEEQGFTGNIDDYYNPANSYISSVLETKRGLPITLSLIYKIVGERLGLRISGIGLPGHFMVVVEDGDNAILIDPFSGGRELSPDEVHSRLQEAFGDEIEYSQEMIQPISNRHWLTRMLQNLLNVFGSKSHYADVAAMLEMEMLLWPDQGHLQRDLGLVLARIGLARPASQWLGTYLKNNPDDPQKMDLKQLLDVLKT